MNGRKKVEKGRLRERKKNGKGRSDLIDDGNQWSSPFPILISDSIFNRRNNVKQDSRGLIDCR